MKISYLIAFSSAFLSVNAEGLIIPLNLSEGECYNKMHTCEETCPKELNVNGATWLFNSCSSSWDVFPELGIGWEDEEDAHDCNIHCKYNRQPLKHKRIKYKHPIKIQRRSEK